MTLEQLRIFVAVAERLHFTRAAEDLGLTQSAVSSAIASLETRTAVRLFHRVGRRVELTVEGHAFLVEARHVLRAARHAEEALDDYAGLRRGRLAVMASQTTAGYWLPPRLVRFRQRHPAIHVDLGIGNTAQVAAAVAAGEAELGFVEGEVEQPLLVRRTVADDRLVLVVGGEHQWAAHQALEADDFLRLPWVVREPGSGTRAALESLLFSRGLSLSNVPHVLQMPSNESVRTAVEAGAGASVLSMLVVETALKAGSLQAAACALPGRKFTLLHHRDRPLSRVAQAFLALLG